jgi:hypothetical protein
MPPIFSAPLQAKRFPPYVIYWNGDQDWILIDEAGGEVASMYRQTLVEKLTQATESADKIQDARGAERRIYSLMSRPGKKAATFPAAVVEYFEQL